MAVLSYSSKESCGGSSRFLVKEYWILKGKRAGVRVVKEVS